MGAAQQAAAGGFPDGGEEGDAVMARRILVTGGSGYIRSHTFKALARSRYVTAAAWRRNHSFGPAAVPAARVA